MRIVIAIDSFKGCLTSAEAAEAARIGVAGAAPTAEVIVTSISDGGEGWLEAFRMPGDDTIMIDVRDPLGRTVSARYLRRDATAIIEVAEACGLRLLAPAERNPLIASTYGVGQIVADAIARGCTDFIIGLGGSATSDAGRGMMAALANVGIPEDCRFTIATDVDNPLYGLRGAAAVFGPQKGATPEMITTLDNEARAFAQEAAQRLGFDRSQEPGAGAAGGLGYAFMQFMNAKRKAGIDLLLDSIAFDDIAADADLIITGEGRADRQTLMGKAPIGILKRAQRHNTPVILIAGQVDDREQLIQASFADVVGINKKSLPLGEALKPDVAFNNIKETVTEFLTHVFKPR